MGLFLHTVLDEASTDDASSAIEPWWASQTSNVSSSRQVEQLPAAVIVTRPLQIRDNRFDFRRTHRWFRCDGCGARCEFLSQGFPYDGCFVEYEEGSLKPPEWWEAWESGTNFTWYCITCHAVQLGRGTSPAEMYALREELGLFLRLKNGDFANAIG